MADEQENIKQNFNFAQTGLNMDLLPSQLKQGMLSYSLNSAVENFDANGISYQNEAGNTYCLSFPEGFVQIGTYFIGEKNKHIFFITNPNLSSGDKDEIGYMENNDCVYRTIIHGDFGFNVHHPIHKCAHKVSNCATEIYWTDGLNPRRYLNIEKIPRVLIGGTPACDPIYGDDVDINQLKLQPNFSIPQLTINDVTNIGTLVAGTYQFAVQYSDISGNAYTSYYSITNPTPIADISIVTKDFNTQIGKSIVLDITNLDLTGQFQYFNLAVIKTINAISSVELVGTYFIDGATKQIIYTGQVASKTTTNLRLSINDIFEKFPYYDVAADLTAVQDVLVWDGLMSIDRINYQQIANKIKLQWETWRIPAEEDYGNEVNATNLRSYLRDEVYPFEIVFLLKNGKQTDGFHIPGRLKNFNELGYSDIPDTDPDFIGSPAYYSGSVGYSPFWQIYNTASVNSFSPEYSTDSNYKGAYQSGEFAYWESTEEYPCNENVWGELAGQKIRHHKFPDVLVSPIFESKIFTSSSGMVMGNDAIFPIGVKIDVGQIKTLISISSLTSAEKDDIVGFKIVRGDRSTNKSVIAKGILRNVGKYEREGKKFYFPNYPYNDLNQDVFINGMNNAYEDECISYIIQINTLIPDPITGMPYAEVSYIDCNTNNDTTKKYSATGTFYLCSIGRPRIVAGTGTAGTSSYDVWNVNSGPLWSKGFRYGWYDRYLGYTTAWMPGNLGSQFSATVYVVPNTGGVMLVEGPGGFHGNYVETVEGYSECAIEQNLPAIKDTPDLAYRQIFNSPETSFSKPFLGNILKLESVIFGTGIGHFTEVKNNAKYRLLTEQAQYDALLAAEYMSALASPFDLQIMFSAYQAYQQIYINGITRRNFAYSYNSIADYNYSVAVPNNEGVKQRNLDIKKYLVPSVVSTTDDLSLNNWYRETSVYLRTIGAPLDGNPATITPLPFPDHSPNMLLGGIPIVTDVSRMTIGGKSNCNFPAKEEQITVVSYYASIKNYFVNQWGQIYSYNTIDTGYQNTLTDVAYNTIFGGDTFINRFAFKTKLPFFLDNRVNAPDDSDIFYDEIGNIGFPKFWHSARSILKNFILDPVILDGADGQFSPLTNIISYKAHNFDCPNDQGSITSEADRSLPGRTYYDGYYYLFAYGIPNFYCESSVNVDLRQAFNNKEGDFFPHVTNHIPDDWVQENHVPIAQDNTYYYNTTFSKQNKENVFTHLPPDWEDKLCFTLYPFRAIYSDSQNTDSDNRVNAWLNYRALSYFDFPQNYGKLTSLDGIQNKAVLARFENKTLMYDNLLTIDTSNPQAAYVGNPYMFKKSPPIDFAETDLGYIGSQNKMLLKIPQGQLTVDAKRGQVFLLNGASNAVDLSGFGSGLNRFFTDHLAFEILRYFPKVDTDNHFNGIGLHGVYDSKFDRLLLTKLDYIPIDPNVKYDETTHEFYIENTITMTVCDCALFGNAHSIESSTTTTTTTEEFTTTTTTTVANVCADCYGVLYNYYAAIDGRGITPTGWHVPTLNDFNSLILYLDPTANVFPNDYGPGMDFVSSFNETVVFSLRRTGEITWNNNSDATNTTGFCAVGSSFRYDDGNSYYIDEQCILMSSVDRGDGSTIYLYIYGGSTATPTIPSGYIAEMATSTGSFKIGMAIRFIKDNDTDPGSVTDNEGNVYPTVKIGNQVWMKQNLKTQHYNNGELIPHVSDGTEWMGLITGACCAYDNDWINSCTEEITTTTTTTDPLVTTTTTTNLISTTTTTTLYSPALRLIWDNILNAPVADPSDVSQWNTWFDIGNNADSPFTSIEVIGNEVRLFGAINLYLAFNQFVGTFSVNLLGIIDEASCVIEVGSFCFSDYNTYVCTNLTTVILPSVGYVGEFSFYTCISLINTNFDLMVTAGPFAFDSCTALLGFDAPVATYFGDYCFAYCSSIITVTAPLLIEAGSNCFAYTSSSEYYDFPSLETAGTYCFTMGYDTVLESINLPIVTSIGGSCFYGDFAATYIYIPLVTSLPGYAFAYCYSITGITCPNLTDIGDYCFSSTRITGSVTLDHLITLGDASFGGCMNITDISLPLVTTIPNNCFGGCIGLINISLPLVEIVGDYSFSYIDASTVSLPSAITIGDFAFHSCYELISIDLPLVTTIGDSVFAGTPKLVNLDLPELLTMGVDTFYSSTGQIDIIQLSSVSFPKLVHLGSGTFKNNGLFIFDCVTPLTYLNIPVCESIGTSPTVADYTFKYIKDQTIDVVINPILRTVNAGGLDANLAYLSSVNTVNLIDAI